MAATVVTFGEWLPDQPALNNHGLTEANNVLPDIGYYRPYNPLATLSAGSYTLPGTALGLRLAVDPTGFGRTFFYGGTDSLLYSTTLTGQFQTRSGVLTAGTAWRFEQFENLMHACNGQVTMFHTVGAVTNFVTSTAPTASVLGKIGQFLFVGDINDGTARPFTVRWSAIGDSSNFPTPNSATAIATQAGEQDMNENLGAVRAIVGGDQRGVIFQDNGITRVTYVGPPAVFQFDEIEGKVGSSYEGVVKNGDQTYFIDTNSGFYLTDGVTTKKIGEGKIDKTFLSYGNSGGFNDYVRGVLDQRKSCVMWSYPEGLSSIASRVIAMNTDTGWWSRANQAVRVVDKSEIGSVQGPYAFDLNNVVCSWRVQTTQPTNIGTATLATGDLELNPGGRAFVNGIKPNIETSATALAITVRVGTRNDLGTTTSYTATTTPTTRTGFADMRVDAKYHRAEVQIVGNFDKAVGIEFKAFLTGET